MLMKKRAKNSLLTIVLILFSVLILIIAGIFIYLKSSLNLSSDFLNGKICAGEDSPCQTTSFTVEEGAYGKSTLVKLEEMGIIKNADLAYYYNRLNPSVTYYFVAGNFEIPHEIVDENGNTSKMRLSDLLKYLSDSSNICQDTVTITFEEGGFLLSYAKILADNLNIDYQDIIDYWNNPDVIKSYMKEYPFLSADIFNDDVKYLLEGFLFPDTYEFFINSSLDQITRKFLDNTLRIYNKYKTDFNNSALSVHDIFTMASIIQWESGSLADSKKIAGVFTNRLNAGEVLASTVTACYAFDLDKNQCYESGDTLFYTQSYNPYNTYTIEGLPPGPVCNPCENAIFAALNPDTTDGYFYFCADMCNGGTVFAKTYSEHEYNIQHYYLACDN